MLTVNYKFLFKYKLKSFEYCAPNALLQLDDLSTQLDDLSTQLSTILEGALPSFP